MLTPHISNRYEGVTVVKGLQRRYCGWYHGKANCIKSLQSLLLLTTPCSEPVTSLIYLLVQLS